MKRILSPSVLSADFAILGEQLALLKKCGVTNIHYDVMDGMYVPSISFGMPVLKSIRKCTDLVLDVHMMVVDPDRYVEDFRKSGADIITVHAEACTHLDRVVNHIKETGAKAAVALNPATPLSALEYHPVSTCLPVHLLNTTLSARDAPLTSDLCLPITA